MNMEGVTAANIKKSLKGKGAAIVGIADIKTISETFGFEEKEFRKYSRAISIGVRLSDEIINGIINGPTEAYAEQYRVMNAKLDELAKGFEKELVDKGFNALAIEASKRYDQKKLAARFPHKTAAILSGLGWIGRSALFISFDHGPRVRLVTVLTNAKIDADIPQKTSECEDCTNCIDACPANAITGELWTYGVARDVIFNAYKCSDYTQLQKKRVGETICGICIAVCPFG
ncbi:MAG: 4Fe-4S double cluster binding domain-containing protein [Candidatus Heimdallarchaeota archaeon]